MLPDPEDRPLLRVDEVLDALRDECGQPLVGRSALYAAIQRGEVPGVVRVGRRVLLATAAIRGWLEVDGPKFDDGSAA